MARNSPEGVAKMPPKLVHLLLDHIQLHWGYSMVEVCERHLLRTGINLLNKK